MSRGDQSVITEHHHGLPPTGEDKLCATAFVADHSFVVELPSRGLVELGRGSDADVQLVSGGVSRAHARIEMRGERGVLDDLGSRNGTFVNRGRITGQVQVGHGDEIGIGDARLALFRKSAMPAGAISVLVHRALLERLDIDIAQGQRPNLFVVQLPERWYEMRAARELIGKLAHAAYVGSYNDYIVAFAVKVARTDASTMLAASRRTLRLAGIDAVAGLAPESTGDAEDLLNGALKSLLSAQEDEADTSEQPIVTDPAMTRLYAEARRIAASPIGVLLIGETGAGKEIFARTIHMASGRQGPLVCVNTAALPEQLLESELFGHERGAFSGAAAAKAGLIESAQGGTLFLDEIGELPMTMQAKLLRVLEDHVVRRVGATTERKIDVRVVAATNCDLDQLVQEKRFRQDLLFRLNGCTLKIPPLRERKAEIPRLSEVFLSRAAAMLGAPQLRLSPAATEALERHSWPGNVRELRNVLERAAALAAQGDGSILPEHLPDSVRATRSTAASSPGDDVREDLRDFERQRIVDALQKTNGNQTQAAELLGLPRRTLAYKMNRLGIKAK